MFRRLLLFLIVATFPIQDGLAESLRVFAAASLTESFSEIGLNFENSSGVMVELNFAGSQQLVAQIRQGAMADVFASADERWMKELVKENRVAAEPAIFAHNRLVVVYPKKNRAGIRTLQDLARPGMKIVLAASTVPVGLYAREVLMNLSKDFGADYSDRVLKNVVSEEENVKAVVAKIELDEADAGIVYATDVTLKVSEKVRQIAIPETSNVRSQYPIAVLKDAPHAKVARDFIEFLRSPQGRDILKKHGFQ